jgi:hypothetical protein
VDSIAAVVDFDQMADAATCLQLGRRLFLELAAVALPLLGYFFCMIAVLAAAVGAMVGLSSTSERVRHYPRPVIERNVTAAKPRLFMAAPETKARSPAKNIEANSASVPTEKADAKKAPHKRKVFARQHGNALGYAEETRNGPQRLFSW